MTLKTGEKAPDFTLISDTGRPFKLSNKIKDKALLVFFPGDGMPVCEQQLSSYAGAVKDFKKLGVEIISINSNETAVNKELKKSLDLPFPVLGDQSGEVAKQYGSWGLFGTSRAVFLVNKDLELRYKHVESVSIFSRSVEELLDTIRRKA